MSLNKIRSEDKRKQEKVIKQQQQKILEQRAIKEKTKIKRNKYYNTGVNYIKQE